MAGEEARRPIRPEDGVREGIRCPYCHCGHHDVTHTFPSEVKFDGITRQYLLRWRKCRYCGCTFKTREIVEPEVPDEIKSPAQAKRVAKEINKALRNILPREDLPGMLDDLKNPFLEE